MMPRFKHPVDFPVNDLLKYMDKLFDAVDTIQIFRILGGEPFLYKDISAIIKRVLDEPKVKTSDIVTNGIIIPDPEILSMLKDTKVTIQISYYGKYSRNADKIKALCDEAGVKCVIRYPDKKTWHDAGDLHFRGRSEKELTAQMKRCGNICRNFQNGKLYFCPRASFGTKLGVPDNPNNFVDLTEDTDRNTLRRQIFELNQRKFIDACNFCDEGTDKCVPVPVAEQL